MTSIDKDMLIHKEHAPDFDTATSSLSQNKLITVTFFIHLFTYYFMSLSLLFGCKIVGQFDHFNLHFNPLNAIRNATGYYSILKP